ncbi:hypothetical protein Sru01_37620 [Sphaerisporangium rufum]|uniref:Uncharacterized protein n=1 Tax=Sphaerisporangium rufum TaxID=1381558 RepID=A0A919V5X7_9ACTN|nr:hypothetical protein [Sphaerisporangium rufum]GII78780.1 hypothetical protein Sru01_37620 [Sphaerisporangium rufum]
MSTPPPGTGPLSPEFSGIDPHLMGGFITELEHARGVIGERTEAIRRVFAANGVPAASLDPIAEVERWIDERLPDLRRRNQIAQATATLPDWSPDGSAGLVPYEEKSTLPVAEARRLGRDLAADYHKAGLNNVLDIGLNDRYRAIVDRLNEHANDAEFTAAFFAALGARETVMLAERLRHGITEDEDGAIAAVSRAFATAISGGAAVAGFAAVSKAMKGKAESEKERRSMGDLLSAGRFPTEWLAQVVATQVFTPGDKTSGKTLAPYLAALAKDPGAARLAVSLATRDAPLPRDVLARLMPNHPATGRTDSRPQLADFLKNLNDRAAIDDTSADTFGKLLAAASGAYDEQDGRHTDAAARFAFTVMTTADDFKLAAPTRIHLSEIAGSYATEIAVGANFTDVDHQSASTLGATKNPVPGLSAAFRLSPQDTYRFIKTFSNTLDNQAPFQQGIGDLALRLTGTASPQIMGPTDIRRLSNVYPLLGGLRGLQLAAREAWGDAKKQADEEQGKAFSWISGNEMGGLGMIVPGKAVGAAIWTFLCAAWSTADTFKSDPPDYSEETRKDDELETLGRQHTIASSLMAMGFTAKVSISNFQATLPTGVRLADDQGNLLPFTEILKQGKPALGALQDWYRRNGMGEGDEMAIGEQARKLADLFDGRKSFTKANTKSLS